MQRQRSTRSLRVGKLIRLVAKYSRILVVYAREARDPISYVRLLRVRLSQSKIGWLVCPHPVTVAVPIRSLGGEITLRSHTTDISVFDELLIGRSYDRLAAIAGSAKVIVDLGANTGLAARWLLDRFPGACLVAVEPDPGNAAILRRNLHGRPATVYVACAGARERRVALVGTREDSFTMQDDPDGSIEVLTMPTLLASLDQAPIDVLKVDIEGAEEELFEGCGSWIGSTRAVCVECHLPFSAHDLLGKLEAGGVRAEALRVSEPFLGTQSVVFVTATRERAA